MLSRKSAQFKKKTLKDNSTKFFYRKLHRSVVTQPRLVLLKHADMSKVLVRRVQSPASPVHLAVSYTLNGRRQRDETMPLLRDIMICATAQKVITSSVVWALHGVLAPKLSVVSAPLP